MVIDNSAELARFKTHLDLEGNNQIIFSGIFGIGKTHFIKEFKEAHTSDYHILLLSPINYSISSTDDIINYIKYDIAFELLRNGETLFEKDEFSIALTNKFRALKNLPPIISGISKMSPLLGKPLEDLLKSFKAWKKVVDKIKKDNASLKIDDKKEIIKFLASINLKEGSIYEDNSITELIACLVESLKKENKQVVLILDDVDRLDPEHIFRILNVFACHFDFGNDNENKFNVNNVVLVCDIENIRQIFHAKYGQNVDFSGYIDKFYSQEVFYFDNKEALRKAVKNAIKDIKLEGIDPKNLMLNNQYNPIVILLEVILYSLINNDLLSLRNFSKIDNKKVKHSSFSFKLDGSLLYNSQFNMSFIWSILLEIYGSPSNVRTTLKKLSLNASVALFSETNIFEMGDLIVMVEYNKHKGNSGEYTYKNEAWDLMITYNIKAERATIRRNPTIVCRPSRIIYISTQGNRNSSNFPFAPLLEIAFENYLTLGKNVF